MVYDHMRSFVVSTGETEFQIGDVRRPITTWLTLFDSRHTDCSYGELMFSLSYLPTAERLTVVVVKARNLKLNENDSNNSQQNVFVKVEQQNNLRKFVEIISKSNDIFVYSGLFTEKR